MINRTDALPNEVAYREGIMGEFTAAFARRLPEALRTPVAFCGPASFREPEIDNCWHPYFIRRGFIFFLIDQIIPMLRSFFAGFRRLILGRFGAYRYFPKASATVLGITPLSICAPTANGVQTNYCDPRDAENMAWIIFNDAGKERGGYGVSRPMVIKEYVLVLWHWFLVSLAGIGKKDWVVASIITLRWIIGLQWVILWMFGQKLESIFQSTRYGKVFCVHEMWPWARVVWDVAARQSVRTSTIQHASIVRQKLWYFPTKAERDAGFSLPNAFAVFSEKESHLLSAFYPQTQFFFGCGPRYAHWKQQNDGVEARVAHASVLFTSSIPWWDNEVVLQGVKKLRESGMRFSIRVRLHPLAVVSWRWRRWLSRAVTDPHSGVTFSHASLKDDIRSAAVVIGMNTTVLEEAAAMERPIIVLVTDRYLSFGTDIGIHSTIDAFSSVIVERALLTQGEEREELSMRGVRALALDQPVFRMT